MPGSRDGGAALTLSHDTDAAADKSSRQLFQERINSILSAPLPRCLQSNFNSGRVHTTGLLEAVHDVEDRDQTRRASSFFTTTPETAYGGTSLGEVRQGRPTKHFPGATLHLSSVSNTPTSPRVPIYEQLLQKGRLQQERLEQLRQEAIEREVQELRPAPRVQLAPTTLPVEPPQPARRLPPAGQRIEDKLLQRAKEKAEQEKQAAQLRKDREEEDLAAVATFHPHISARAQATKARYTEPPVNRAARRARRLEELAQIRQSAELEDLRELQEVPMINRHSAKLAAEKKAREGLEGLPTSEALFIREHRRRLAQLLATEAERDAREKASPSITRHAAMMNRAGDVGSRLHAESYDTAIRRLQREVAWREAHTPFQPQVTTLGAVTAPRYQGEDQASAQTILSLPRSRSAVSRYSTTTRDAFQPMINPVSAAIAKRLPETPMQRLCRPHAVHSLSSYVDPSRLLGTSVSEPTSTPRQQTQARLEMTPTTTPLVPRQSPSSSATAPSPPLPSAVVASLDAYERRRQARLAALRREQSEQELQECTFQPRINARSAAIAAETPHNTARSNTDREQRGPAAVAQRNEEWQQQRERHLETMRQWQEERAAAAETELAERRVRGKAAVHGELATPASSFQSVYGGDGRAWGVDVYLERQQLARAQRQERQEQQDGLRQAMDSLKPA
ncbi:hypothetical protein ABL78_7448 [Leptomonas seymouri]|uniref:Uncharacterized protein n=1 Tax=Leptomonas seymouri TaxID=5684 RepID=A0A0N0P2Y8_LEPSE|nr:hypothetical protein ABL78_7448 [Leptomonas seymouri]|eukprot:KPI83516.1 hypothetical protein ABL78_7448 [Leptomonas seymouri]